MHLTLQSAAPRLALHLRPARPGRPPRARNAHARQCHGQGRRLRHAVSPSGQARLSVASRGRRLALGGVTADCVGRGEDPTPSLPGRHDVTQRHPSPLFSSRWMIWPAARHDDPARMSTARVIGALTGRTGGHSHGALPWHSHGALPGPPTTGHGRRDQRVAAGRGHYVANRDGQDHHLPWETAWTPFTWNPSPRAGTAPCCGSTATSTRTPPRNSATG